MLSDYVINELVTIHRDAFNLRGRIKPWSTEDIRFLALSLSGEAGELANKIKKHWRGDTDAPHPTRDSKLKEELADVVAYCCLLAHALEMSVNGVLLEKLPEIRKKMFTQAGYPDHAQV